MQNLYQNLLNAKIKPEKMTNNNLAKIFEYFSCIKLSEEFNQQYYEYNDLDPNFKEDNNMTRVDSGIDACNLTDTIVQCKLRDNNLTWKECSTFFASQNCYSEELQENIIRWKKLIITRNDDSTLSSNLKEKKKLFLDRTYNKQELIKYCTDLLKDKTINLPKIKKEKKKVRDYQKEVINKIKSMENNKNLIICLPTGTGKNFIIARTIDINKKIIIFVPRIILLEQLKEEIVNYKKEYEDNIQLIGDGNNDFDETKNITICVYNSVDIVDGYIDKFDKIFVDEAHHVIRPEIYKLDYDDEEDEDEDEDSDEELEEDDEELEEELEEEENNEENDENNEEEDNEEEDNEEENKDKDSADNITYINKIKSYQKYNNNIYLSATIDKQDNWDYYKKDIRDMIKQKYLCDYNLVVPIFSDDPTNRNICEYLINNYNNIIIFCNSQKEGNQINKLMNEIQKNSSQYIDCNTPKKKRDDIINKFKLGELSFLVNVRILVEGFDAPITKGICLLHMPSNDKTIIQMVGRTLRLHEDKIISNIILPFSKEDDEKSISNFLKVIARNDSRIQETYKNKKLGGYINLDNYEEEIIVDDNNVHFKYEMIFDNMGILKNGEEIWNKKLEQVKKYIDENNKRPSISDKNKDIKTLGKWISHQQQYFITKQYIMNNESIRKKWKLFVDDDKYKQYFLSNNEKWQNNLNKLKIYIDENNKKPSAIDKNKDIKFLGIWTGLQHSRYMCIQRIMKNKNIRNKWKEFINDKKYEEYFMNNEQKWQNKLDKVKLYIDTNNKRPSNGNKSVKKLSQWVSEQIMKYNNKHQIMSNASIRNKWKDFINDVKYNKYFLSNEQKWLNILEQVKEYINYNKKRPSQVDKNKDIKLLGAWINRQQNYIKIQKSIMNNQNITNKWNDFVNDVKYSKYFNK
jgi:superfamily II DNA or RNA helicase